MTLTTSCLRLRKRDSLPSLSLSAAEEGIAGDKCLYRKKGIFLKRITEKKKKGKRAFEGLLKVNQHRLKLLTNLYIHCEFAFFFKPDNFYGVYIFHIHAFRSRIITSLKNRFQRSVPAFSIC